jgi:nucleoside phosphorylase
VLGVVTGLKSEAKLLRGTELACISTGGRAHIARAKIDRLIGGGVRGLISFGIAGALSPDLKTGDLVIADTITNDIGEVWRTHELWVEALVSSAGTPNNHRADDAPHHAASRRSEGHATPGPPWSSQRDASEEPAPRSPKPSVTSAVRPGPSNDGRRDVRVGGILGLDRMLSLPRDKADALVRRGALCVDMESHHVARAAAESGLPFIAVRAVSDQANEVLPAVMASFVDEQGQTKMSAVLAALILGRVGLGSLLRTGRASARAHQALLRCRGALAGLG